MPRNNAGTYSAPAGAWNPAVNGTTMSTDDWNALLSDIASALTASVAADGQTTTTARIPFSQGAAVNAGSVGVPGLGIIGDLTSGLYQPASGQIGLAAAGTAAFYATSTAATLPLNTTALGTLTVNGALSAASISVSGAEVLSGAFIAGGATKLAGSGSTLGFYGATGATKATITGSRGANAALASLLTALASLGLITDSSS